jgi:hypothetical protein
MVGVTSKSASDLLTEGVLRAQHAHKLAIAALFMDLVIMASIPLFNPGIWPTTTGSVHAKDPSREQREHAHGIAYHLSMCESLHFRCAGETGKE